LEKKIKENLSFISNNSKYISNIQKLNNKTKNIFPENLFFSQNNNQTIFQTNKNIFYKTTNIISQNNENESINFTFNIKKENNFLTKELSETNNIKEAIYSDDLKYVILKAITIEGEEILIDGESDNVKYVPLCGDCYLQKVKKINYRKILK
jgi:hypothetical protein